MTPTLDRAIEMRERGRSIPTIARITQTSPHALAWQFLKLAIDPPRPKKLRPHQHMTGPVIRRSTGLVRAYTPEEDARLLDMAAAGTTRNGIARELGRSNSSVRGRLMTLARREEREATVP